MYLLYFTTLCLTGPIIASYEEQMEMLLRRPFWETVVSEYPNIAIKDETEEVTLRELFAPGLNNKIVDEINRNEKIRQFHLLLSVIYGDFMYNFLEFLSIIQKHHLRLNLQWNCKDDLVLLIQYYDNITSMAYNSLFLLESWYQVDDSYPLINDVVQYVIFKLKLTENLNEEIFYRSLDTLMIDLNFFFSNNFNATANLTVKVNDLLSINRFIALVLNSNFSQERRITYFKDFLKYAYDDFLKFFNDVGFVFDENTREVNLIL
ncbi:uncharacterized protein LOC126905489 [Daktulosphaira vitifoliae]|uniref:uncharacterized protein LOC126905489 n=1 Tax=Daktulosphaira vitifoliae TaxID=58002 RepID=UPI0021AAB200|nr:uncharacterized protein LOC126905489 [Daktulosphaira vitifoliae]